MPARKRVSALRAALRQAQGRPERRRGTRHQRATALSPSRSERDGESFRGWGPGRREKSGAPRSIRKDDGHALLVITVREGRNRQVRKMCEAIGHPVTRLKRVAIGPLRDEKLKLGHWRELAPEEVRRLRAATDALAREKEKHYHGRHGNERRTRKT